MAGTDLALDADGDFVDDGAGGWKETSSIEPLCRYQLLDDFGRFFADPTAGSRVFEVPRKVSASALLEREDAWREALGVFVAQGLAEDLVVETDTDQRGRVVTSGSITDLAAGTIDLTPLLSFGVGD